MLPVAVFLAIVALAASIPAEGQGKGQGQGHGQQKTNLDRRPVLYHNALDDEVHRDVNYHIQRSLALRGKRAQVRDAYTDYAMTLWLTKEFYNMYAKYSVPEDPQQVARGKQVFESIQQKDYHITSDTGIIHDVPVENIKKMADQWYNEKQLTDAMRQKLNLALDAGDFRKTNTDSGGVGPDQSVSFVQLGYATTDIFDNKKGSIAYAFRNVKFTMAPTMKEEFTQECIIWGLFCKTKYEIKFINRTLSAEESLDMTAYLRQEALKVFWDDNKDFVDMMQKKAKQFEPFLPDAIRKKVENIDNNPDKRPDQVEPEDPLDGNKLPWSQKK